MEIRYPLSLRQIEDLLFVRGKEDLDALQKADVVVAILNGNSPGTVFEVGYAAALGKPVFCIAQNVSENDLKLPIGTECSIHQDFVTGLHAVARRT